jgi:hypothetical protein
LSVQRRARWRVPVRSNGTVDTALHGTGQQGTTLQASRRHILRATTTRGAITVKARPQVSAATLPLDFFHVGHIRCRGHRVRRPSVEPACGSLRRLREFCFLPSLRGPVAELLRTPTRRGDASVRFRSIHPAKLFVGRRDLRSFDLRSQHSSPSENSDRASVQRVFRIRPGSDRVSPGRLQEPFLRIVPGSRRVVYDRGVVHQALDRSTLTNLSVGQNRGPSQGFRTGSRTGIPDSMSFCWSAIVTAWARFWAPIFA